MELKPGDRKIARWRYTADVTLTKLNVTVYIAGAWHVPYAVTNENIELVVASPGATGNPAGTVVLNHGVNTARIRVTDNPEILTEDAGAIRVLID